MDAQQSDLLAALPVFPKKCSYLLEDFCIQLGWNSKRVSAGDGREIFITEFQLHGASMQSMFAQPAAHHFGKTHEGRLQLFAAGCILSESVLMADGFRIGVGTHIVVEPSSSIVSLRLTGKCQAPLAKPL